MNKTTFRINKETEVMVFPRGSVFRAYIKFHGKREVIVPDFHTTITEAYDAAVKFAPTALKIAV